MQDERKTHWEQVYREKSPVEVSWYQTAPTLSWDLIRASGVAVDAPLIDVGGGASTLVDHLLEQGYRGVSVLDISAQALAHARQRLGERARDIRWIEADVTRFAPPRRYRLWHDRAVFHFLTEAADRARSNRTARRSSAPSRRADRSVAAVCPLNSTMQSAYRPNSARRSCCWKRAPRRTTRRPAMINCSTFSASAGCATSAPCAVHRRKGDCTWLLISTGSSSWG